MREFYSPLRYPGGKTSILKDIIEIVDDNGQIENYVEPYAGGAGLALGLLFKGKVKRIILNDIDYGIYCFWYSVLYCNEDLIEKIRITPVNIREWKKQNFILNSANKTNRKLKSAKLDMGFAAFFINRCNRSGILRSCVGPIGGKEQKSHWKIDARFKKDRLIDRINNIAKYKNKIKIYNLDAIEFLSVQVQKLNLDMDKTIIYMDPPYYVRGAELYRAFYNEDQHIKLQKFLEDERRFKWILSYDAAPFIERLYKKSKMNGFSMNHFANKAKVGNELIIVSDNCFLPEKERLKLIR